MIKLKNPQPWIAYGQTPLPPDTYVYNPATLTAGLVGEQVLPYTVPEGKVLVLTRVSIESHWGSAMWLWTGVAPFTWPKALETFKAEERMDPSTNSMPTVEWHVMKFLQADTILNVALMSQNQPTVAPWAGGAYRQGWEISGFLCDAPGIDNGEI